MNQTDTKSTGCLHEAVKDHVKGVIEYMVYMGQDSVMTVPIMPRAALKFKPEEVAGIDMFSKKLGVGTEIDRAQ